MPNLPSIPTPKFQIGQVVHFRPDPYWRREMLRHLIRAARACAEARDDERGKPLIAIRKQAIREKMRMFDHPDRVQICGIVPLYGHPYDRPGTSLHIFNACYLTPGQCHGGLVYGYLLMFMVRHPDPQHGWLAWSTDQVCASDYHGLSPL